MPGTVCSALHVPPHFVLMMPPEMKDHYFISQERKPGLHGRKWQGGLCDPVASPLPEEVSSLRAEISPKCLCVERTLYLYLTSSLRECDQVTKDRCSRKMHKHKEMKKSSKGKRQVDKNDEGRRNINTSKTMRKAFAN